MIEQMQSSGPVIALEQDDLANDMDGSRKNALQNAASGYLRSAFHQPVDWIEWSHAAFDRAAKQDKPILLDIGASWCHWCHVMDRESYEDPATARIINDNFIAIKVDRDERPDVDTRYQAAISAISGQGGWPLTAFLTPEGKPYFGGTYFPPEDRHGRPSFQRVLLTMAEAFAMRREEVNESAGSVMEAIEHNESFAGHAGNPGAELLETLALATLKGVDMKHGGFGGQPKFPHSSALDLLIDLSSRSSTTTIKLAGQGAITIPEAARRAAILTLDKMAKGGIHDQLAGGFHRYSVDEHWVVPHFEKMAYDNCELLKNYVHGYLAYGEERFAEVGRDIVRWMDECLSDRVNGGFYAAQDADVTLDDDGDYFTWTLDEAGEVLAPAELAVAAAYYDIGEIGDMQHNVARNVLHNRLTLEAVARKVGINLEQAQRLLVTAKKKMLAARLERPTPYIDKTVYVGWNAMCISAYLAAHRALRMPEAKTFALRTLDRILQLAWSPEFGLSHVAVYGEGVAGVRVPGVLDDYAFLGHAALDAWETTGELRHFQAATDLAQFAIDHFYDSTGGGFFDTQHAAKGALPLGALGTLRKPLQDSPTPAGNPTAAMLLMRLSELNSRLDYAEKAQQTMEAFAAVVEHFSIYAATYALALQRLVREPVHVSIIGEGVDADALEAAALATYAVNKSVLRLPSLNAHPLPEVLANTLPRLPHPEGCYAVVCSGHSCHLPITSPEELTNLLSRTI